MNRRSFLSLMGWGYLASQLPKIVGDRLAQSPSQTMNFYLAPNGNDAWSGQLAQPNETQTDGPFATLPRAREAIRQLKRQWGNELQQPVTVWLRGGTYFLQEVLVFAPEDGGTADCPVTWSAYQGETAIVSGGKIITDWQSVNVNGQSLWAAQIPEVQGGEWVFRQLWVNDGRQPRARYPNQGVLTIAALPDVTPETSGDEGQNRFEYHPGDIQVWDNLADVEVVLLHTWVTARLPIASVDPDQNLVTFTRSTRRRMTETKGTQQPARYYVENALELLDTPGEWYLNRQTGVLYYFPRPGEQMGEVEVIAPVLSQLVRLEGLPKTEQFVEFLKFRGLQFAHTRWDRPANNAGDTYAALGMLGAIAGQGVRHCSWEHCTIAHTGGYALELSWGCQHNSIVACHFWDLGAGGIQLGERQIRDRPSEQTHNHQIVACHIQQGGQVFHQGVGIWVGNSYENSISHNCIHDFSYSGIAAGWSFRYGPSAARDNIIESNYIHHIGIQSNGESPTLLNDLGAIYTMGAQPGTVILNNLCHDIAALIYGGWGIYFDQGSSYILAENNLIYRTTDGGFHQNFGKENILRNNIFAFGRDTQLERSRQEEHISFRFEGNIIYWEQGKLVNKRWGESGFFFDRNLYWKVGGGEISFRELSWQDWQNLGMDLNSAIADPGFIDPENGDFRLSSDSPAFQLGFEPLSFPSWNQF